MRFHWIRAELAELDYPEMHELVIEAWRMVVPKFLYAEYLSRAGGSDSDHGSSG